MPDSISFDEIFEGVFGNNDGDKFRHLIFKDKLGIDVQYEDRFLEIVLNNRTIAVFHGDYPEIVDALVKCGKYDVVLHGHTHQRINTYCGKTLSLNPGSLLSTTLGKAFGASCAIYDTTTNQGTHLLLG